LYGKRPVVAIFAREITDDLTSLVKQIDKKIAENTDQKMASFLVLLTDDPDALEPKLKHLAIKHKIKNIPLTIFDGIAGPPKYKIAEGADVTVLMWRKQTVKVNHALTKLNKKSVKKIVSDLDKILDES
jgi:hypothetical protein